MRHKNSGLLLFREVPELIPTRTQVGPGYFWKPWKFLIYIIDQHIISLIIISLVTIIILLISWLTKWCKILKIKLAKLYNMQYLVVFIVEAVCNSYCKSHDYNKGVWWWKLICSGVFLLKKYCYYCWLKLDQWLLRIELSLMRYGWAAPTVKTLVQRGKSRKWGRGGEGKDWDWSTPAKRRVGGSGYYLVFQNSCLSEIMKASFSNIWPNCQ